MTNQELNDEIEYYENYLKELETFQYLESLTLTIREYMSLVPELETIKAHIRKLKKVKEIRGMP